MKKLLISALALAATTSFALAQTTTNPADKQMKDSPGVTGGGSTANPTAEPMDSSPTQKQMRDNAGASSNTGTTADPTAKPETTSPATTPANKEMKDLPGAK